MFASVFSLILQSWPHHKILLCIYCLVMNMITLELQYALVKDLYSLRLPLLACRKLFLKKRKSAVKIQSMWRMHIQRKKYIILRDEERERKRKAEEERRRQEEERKRLEEEKRRQEEEKRRLEEEKRRQAEEARREAEQSRKELEERVRTPGIVFFFQMSQTSARFIVSFSLSPFICQEVDLKVFFVPLFWSRL